MWSARFDRRLLLIGVVAALASACQGPFDRLQGSTMGTYFTIVHDDCAVSLSTVETQLKSLNQALSTYQADSEISRFNTASANTEVDMSTHFAVPLLAARQVWRESGGAFDPTVGPLVDLWGFGPGSGRKAPSQAQIDAIQPVLGMDLLTVQDRRLRKSLSGQRLDLSAIAKGYAVDQLAQRLTESGCRNFMVDIGGEMSLSGVNAQGQPWRVGVEKPDPGSLGTVQLVLELQDISVATSGDYRNFRVVDGRRVDHVMDPRTGAPADNQVVSATVVHDEAMFADAYATTAMVLGVAEALALAEQTGFALFLMTRSTDDDQVKVHYNERMENFMVTPAIQ